MFRVGDRVEAKFGASTHPTRASKYYPGKVTKIRDDSVDIAYDDGDKEQKVLLKFVRPQAAAAKAAAKAPAAAEEPTKKRDRPKRGIVEASAAAAAAAVEAPAQQKKRKVASASPAESAAEAPAQKKRKVAAATAPAQAAAAKKPSPPMASASPPEEEPWTSPVVAHGGGRKGSFTACVHETVKPHTLILGTQPADASLKKHMYFARDANAFWHIVGAALGFRRGFHETARDDIVPSIAAALPPPEQCEVVAEYGEAVRRLGAAGYALWDMLESSVREGSLDSAIKKAKAAKVEELVAAHPSIRRIVFATGKGSADIFRKKFAEWLARGDFYACAAGEAREVFSKEGNKGALPVGRAGRSADAIELVVPPSVSPASATVPFGAKLAQWKELVFDR